MVTIPPRDEEAEEGDEERLGEDQEGDVGEVEGEEERPSPS